MHVSPFCVLCIYERACLRVCLSVFVVCLFYVVLLLPRLGGPTAPPTFLSRVRSENNVGQYLAKHRCTPVGMFVLVL